VLAGSPAEAQSAEDRQAAGRAYNRGSAAYLAEDWPEAARWFEMAHRLAPAAPALVQAVRAHRLAGNELRAATLSLRLLTSYPNAEPARATAREVLEAYASQFFRVDVVCEECTLELDGAVLEHTSFFVTPDEPHTIRASFPTGEVEEQISGGAGEQRELPFDAPPPTVAGDLTAEADPVTSPPPTTTRHEGDDGQESSGLSPVFFIASAALTVGAGAVLVWSGLDALAGVDEYEMNPTAEALAAGQSKELRTNVMIGVTAGLAATTLVFAIFTDWSGGDESDEATAWSIGPTPGGAAATLRGRF
jgi:hypothetical protein